MMKKDGKPILLLDFDGVIHSYTSGWKGARFIPDPPVDGALEFIVKATEDFKVCIYSSRSRQFGGKRAMKKWIRRNLMSISEVRKEDRWRIPSSETGEIPKWWFRYISKTAFADPWPDEVRWAIHNLLKSISFPTKKPAAFLTIDDRAICFDGHFQEPEKLLTFKPWNKQKL